MPLPSAWGGEADAILAATYRNLYRRVIELLPDLDPQTQYRLMCEAALVDRALSSIEAKLSHEPRPPRRVLPLDQRRRSELRGLMGSGA